MTLHNVSVEARNYSVFHTGMSDVYDTSLEELWDENSIFFSSNINLTSTKSPDIISEVQLNLSSIDTKLMDIRCN